MFVVRQVPTFMLCAANTSLRLVLSAGSAVGSGVASEDAGVDSSVEVDSSVLVSSEEITSEEDCAGVLFSAEPCVLPLSHPIKDKTRRPVVNIKMLFFFKFHTLLSARFFTQRTLSIVVQN